MRRLMILTVMLAFLFALVMTWPRASRVVKADDPCFDCMQGVEQRYELCMSTIANAEVCGDMYNEGVVACYATVCEQ